MKGISERLYELKLCRSQHSTAQHSTHSLILAIRQVNCPVAVALRLIAVLRHNVLYCIHITDKGAPCVRHVQDRELCTHVQDMSTVQTCSEVFQWPLTRKHLQPPWKGRCKMQMSILQVSRMQVTSPNPTRSRVNSYYMINPRPVLLASRTALPLSAGSRAHVQYSEGALHSPYPVPGTTPSIGLGLCVPSFELANAAIISCLATDSGH